MIIYCTNDCLSAHTAKRKAYFKQHSIPCRVVGIANLSNSDVDFATEIKYKTHNKNCFKYAQRLVYAFRILISLKPGKSDKVILRGWEFVSLKWLISKKVFIEITDIPNVVLKWSILRTIFKSIHSKNALLITSVYFGNFFKSNKYYLWHNVSYPITINLMKDPIAYETTRIIYAGYLRGISDLFSRAKWAYDITDFYGKRNIVGGGSNMILEKKYFGEYNYKDLNKLYSQYRFGYISDFFGLNSVINLTNRIYEVILNFTLPVHIKRDSTAYFLDEHDLFYIQSPRELQEVLDMSQKEFLALVEKNRGKLLKTIMVENEILNEVLKG